MKKLLIITIVAAFAALPARAAMFPTLFTLGLELRPEYWVGGPVRLNSLYFEIATTWEAGDFSWNGQFPLQSQADPITASYPIPPYEFVVRSARAELLNGTTLSTNTGSIFLGGPTAYFVKAEFTHPDGYTFFASDVQHEWGDVGTSTVDGSALWYKSGLAVEEVRSGQFEVPDHGSTIATLGLGIAMISVFRRRPKR